MDGSCILLLVMVKSLVFIIRVIENHRGFGGLKSDIILFELLKVALGTGSFCLKVDESGRKSS